MAGQDAVDGGGRSRLRAAVAVILSAILLVVTGGLADAGADDPPPTTTGADSPTTIVDDADDPGSSTSLTGGVTTTTRPGATTTTIGPGAFGPPTTDPDAPPEPPMADPSPEVRILLGQLLDQSHEQLVAREHEVVATEQVDVDRYVDAETAAGERLAGSRTALDAVTERLAGIEAALKADALARYMDPGITGLELLVDTEDDAGTTRATLIRVTTDLHLEYRGSALVEADRLRSEIAERREGLDAARSATGAARKRADDARERAREQAEAIENEKRFIDEVNRAIETERVAARTETIGASGDGWSLPIAGRSVFTAEELAKWFNQRGFPSRAQAPVEDLARYYIEEGEDQGIRGDMAFAQSILETGSFTNRDTVRLNNFAGIGHCDTCPQGFAFATPQLGVRAQMQLLADYTERGVELAHPMVDRRLRGPSGCCRTWWQLTHIWATAGNYGPKMMAIYREMLHWLVLERGMTPAVSAR